MIERLNEALEGRYRIERKLGEGGMATVYVAHDVRHERRVAIKVLRPELAAVVGAERFLAEIRTTAALQHPHILALHDSGEADGFLFYVMPYVQGESLRERLVRERQLPVDEAVELARKVADALDYAHERGVVHRDVKPGNVLLSERGEPLVADFGIALAVSEAGEGRITETGLSLGTPHYMSPEQASGDQSVDRRTDVYALGCVLHEMLVGEPPHGGSTAQAVLARILTGEPQRVREARPTVPPNVDAAVAKALEKLPADRFGGAAVFAEALEDPGFRYVRSEAGQATSAEREPAVAASGEMNRERFAWITITALLVMLGVWGWAGYWRALGSDPAGDDSVRLTLDLGTLEPAGDVVISPDGRRLAVSAEVDGEQAIWTRRLDESAFRAIPGTEDGLFPTFSPDGEWIAFTHSRQGTLVKARVSGGEVVTLVDDPAIEVQFPHWGDDGTIAISAPGGLYVVSETGAGLRRLRSLQSPVTPHVLPGGQAVVTTTYGGPGIHYVHIEADTSHVVVPEGSHPTYVRGGYLLYVPPPGGLMALPFDPDEGQPTGEPVRVLERVASGLPVPKGYDVSTNGGLVYLEGEGELGGGPAYFVLMDREGNADTLSLPPQRLGRMRISPDGRFIAYETGRGSPDLQIHTFDLTTGRTTPLTSEGTNGTPVWSPDGTRIAFRSSRSGLQDEELVVVPAEGGEEPTSLLSLSGAVGPTSWPREDLIAFHRIQSGESGWNLWTLTLGEDGGPAPWLDAPWLEMGLQISPDGRLAAYISGESGRMQVMVRTFPDPAESWLVSRADASSSAVRWSPDGAYVYFWTQLSPADSLYRARIQQDETGIEVGAPEPIFGARVEGSSLEPFWDIHPDGERFIVALNARDRSLVEDEAGGTEDRYVVVLNWFEELEERMGGGR